MHNLSVFEYINENLKTLEIDEIVTLLGPLKIGMTVVSPTIPRGTFLYRGRKINKAFKEESGFKIRDLSYSRCVTMSGEYHRLILGFVCGGDGVCAIDWAQGSELLGTSSGWIAAARKHNQSYRVWGTKGSYRTHDWKRFASRLYQKTRPGD